MPSLEGRVTALEAAVTALEAAVTALEAAVTALTAEPAPASPVADEVFWALHGLQEKQGDGVLLAGSVDGPRANTTSGRQRHTPSTCSTPTGPTPQRPSPRSATQGDTRIGYAWFTDRHGDREITWHNGGTGGFRSYIGLRPGG